MRLETADLKKVTIKDSFWDKYTQLVTDEVIPYQWKVLNDELEGVEPSHAIRNIRIAAGKEKGDFYGFVFQDSDLAKWLEAVAYSLAWKPDEKLEEQADAAYKRYQEIMEARKPAWQKKWDRSSAKKTLKNIMSKIKSKTSKAKKPKKKKSRLKVQFSDGTSKNL